MRAATEGVGKTERTGKQARSKVLEKPLTYILFIKENFVAKSIQFGPAKNFIIKVVTKNISKNYHKRNYH